MRKVNLAAAFATFDDAWSPKIAGEINDAYVKLVKLRGTFDWHHHEVEDELFLVTAGRLRMGLRTGDIDLEPGEFIVVPHGTEHRPEALTGECCVLLLEPKTTLNTGNVVNERTVADRAGSGCCTRRRHRTAFAKPEPTRAHARSCTSWALRRDGS